MVQTTDNALSKKMLDVILQDSSEIFALSDEKGEFSYLSPALSEVTNFEPKELVGKKVIDLIHPEDQRTFKTYFSKKLHTIEEKDYQTVRFQCKDHTYKWVECRVNNHLKTEEIGAVKINLKDITDFKSVKEQLEKNEQRFQRAQEISHLGNWEIDFAEDTLTMSDEVFKIFGLEPGTIEPTLEDFFTRVHPKDFEFVKSEIDKAYDEGKAVTLTYRIICEDGSTRHVYSESRNEYNNKGERIGLYGIFHDITEQKKAEISIKESALNLEKAFNIALIGTWKYDILNDKYSWSQSAIDVIGFKEADVPTTFEEYLNFIPPEHKSAVTNSSIDLSAKGTLDIEHQVKVYRQTKWIRMKCHVEFDKDGTPVKSSGIIQDVSRHKSIEAKIQKALEEKITLLSEVHHRVKNNLAIISGLLELQHMEMENEEARFRLKESINRISSIAMVHELIYQSEAFSSVDIQEYLEKLIPGIMDTMITDQKDVAIDVDIDNCQLNISEAIPLGLLLNELLTNSFKYAFKGREKGEIFIHLKQLNSKLKVLYKDDGVGFNEGFDFEEPVNLGLNLIHSQLQQLKANYTVDTHNQFKLEFQFIRESLQVQN